MRAIILAAGMGTRMGAVCPGPKCLIRVGGELIIRRTLQLLDSVGVDDIALVTGYQGNLVEAIACGREPEMVRNPFYSVTNSIASLWFARDLLDQDVIILNSDLVFRREMLEVVLASPRPCLAVDPARDGGYRAAILWRKVITMGMGLTSPGGEYAGMTVLDGASAKKLRHRVEQMVEEGVINEWYETAVASLILDGEIEMGWCDVSRWPWAEIDTPDDLITAEVVCE